MGLTLSDRKLAFIILENIQHRRPELCLLAGILKGKAFRKDLYMLIGQRLAFVFDKVSLLNFVLRAREPVGQFAVVGDYK